MVEREFIPLNIGVLRVLETGVLADDADVDAIVGRLAEAGHVIAARETVTDSKSLIREQITTWIGDRGIDVIVAIGGTDSTPTDPMLDALAPLVSRQFFGFGEVFRAIIHEEAGTASIFSHAEAALCNSTYVILLPATGFTAAAVDRLLLPQLDHRTKPRNLAMSLPRLAGVPQETMSGDTPAPTGRAVVPPRKTGAVPVMSGNTSRTTLPPAPPPAPPRTSTAMEAVSPPRDESAVRRPPTVPGIAPIEKPVSGDEPQRPRNPFADALKEAAQQRRTASVVAQLPKPEPMPEPAVVIAAFATEPASPAPRVVDLAAIEAAKDGHALPESTSGTIDMDALVTAAAAEDPAPVKPVPRVTAPPPFVKRNTTSQVAVVPQVEPRATASASVPEPAEPAVLAEELPKLLTRTRPTAAPPEQRLPTKDKDFRELAISSKSEGSGTSARMFVEGRRRRRTPQQLAVLLLLIVAGLSVVAATVVVIMSMKRNPPVAQRPPDPGPSAPVAVVAPDAAVVPQHDPVEIDAGAEIEMPPMVETVDAGALALHPPPANPNRPVPQHDPVVVDAGAAVPVHDDGCDEVSCVLDHYAKPCCSPFKPPEPPPVDPNASKTPLKLDRTMVQPAVEAIKPLVIQCGERPAVPKGTVKVTVRVGADGKVTGVSVAESPDVALGDCVAAAMQRAVFPVTQTGGGFTYPFVF